MCLMYDVYIPNKPYSGYIICGYIHIGASSVNIGISVLTMIYDLPSKAYNAYLFRGKRKYQAKKKAYSNLRTFILKNVSENEVRFQFEHRMILAQDAVDYIRDWIPQ